MISPSNVDNLAKPDK